MPTQPLPAGVDPRTPVLIGVGQHLQRTDRGDPELSPAALMTESLRLALTDSGSDSPDALGRSLGWIGAVPALTWRYNDAAREVADSIGADGAITATCAMGGHSPNYLLGAAARAIATGALDVAAITGGEAGRARAAHRATGAQPDWGTQGDDVAPDQMVGPTELEMAHPAEAAHRLYMPTQMYPLFETALRAASGRCIDDHQADVGELWAGFAGVAACNPHAWDRTPYTAAELITPSASNRWVGWPYTKHLVSNARVDMGASVLVASAQAAAAAGVPTDRWIFLHSGTDAVDRLASERASFADSPAMRIAGGRALQLAGLTPNDLDFIDLYSCFPSAVQLAANALGIDTHRALTTWGGLCFAGGPWNNPVSHALAATVDALRDLGTGTALVTANGGIVHKHSFCVLATEPPRNGFRWESPQAEVDASDAAVPVVLHPSGPASIEAYTVMHDRGNLPERAHAAVRLADGARAWAFSDDADTMDELMAAEGVGRSVSVDDAVLRLTS
ncbi:hypothetical protein [Candidatus Neomicrothrix sp.]|jgi:acetyl-CoA C-acetyltransferase|uniref:hypothetical protein n=1 Tax=Candidatus Neomicrothrix sp. TaxID=2719034 RepID=UPI001B68E8A6|nr:hypothetical protein [Candidatus Microthrix sp.]MBK7323006.1 hypothetical protein [Candidatus Microthrix sp.]MBL0206198.1 hypothetical protein [Candidatus Microthrix sp.]MBP6134688.1 hypothetical protein [Candidatus Microthrix sp.]MBP6150541.1 hypothetical protein [Candidatus Microthrix sp.]MBP7993954.1 hypothetical protein [Candidatus Microthrix sp.]